MNNFGRIRFGEKSPSYFTILRSKFNFKMMKQSYISRLRKEQSDVSKLNKWSFVQSILLTNTYDEFNADNAKVRKFSNVF